MADNEALQDSEQDFSIPGEADDDMGQGAPPPSSQPVQATQPPPQAQATAQQPRISGKTQFFGNLLSTLLNGVRNTQGNPNNAFDRGFHNASPQVQQEQQANLSKVQSEADLAKMQVSLTGMKALQYEYLLKRLPQQLQEQHLKVVSEFKQNLIKEGASVEAEGTDEKAADGQATYLNGSDPRSTNHAGKFYSLPTMDSDGKPKFDVVYVPNKDTLQNDFKWEDSEGNEHTISAGTPFSGALGKFVELQQKDAQSQTKSEHKMLGDALKPNVPPDQMPGTIAWLESQLKENTPLAQQNKNAMQAQVTTLRAAMQMVKSEKMDVARAGASIKEETKEKGNMYYAEVGGRQVAGSAAELKRAGVSDDDLVKVGEAETEKIINARTLDKQMGKAESLIDSLNQRQELGAFISRWNTLASKKVGAGDPEFTRLLAQIGLNETALMQVHVGARGSSQLMEHFKELADAGKMDYRTLKAAVQQEHDYIRDKSMRAGGGGSETPAKPQGVPANAVWNPEARQWRLPQ